MVGLHLVLCTSLDESCPPPDTRGCIHLSFARFDLVSLSPGVPQGSYLFTAERVGLPNRHGRLDVLCSALLEARVDLLALSLDPHHSGV